MLKRTSQARQKPWTMQSCSVWKFRTFEVLHRNHHIVYSCMVLVEQSKVLAKLELTLGKCRLA